MKPQSKIDRINIYREYNVYYKKTKNPHTYELSFWKGKTLLYEASSDTYNKAAQSLLAQVKSLSKDYKNIAEKLSWIVWRFKGLPSTLYPGNLIENLAEVSDILDQFLSVEYLVTRLEEILYTDFPRRQREIV